MKTSIQLNLRKETIMDKDEILHASRGPVSALLDILEYGLVNSKGRFNLPAFLEDCRSFLELKDFAELERLATARFLEFNTGFEES